MPYHQRHNSIGGDIYNGFFYREIQYTPHLHRGFEFTYVLEGTLTAAVAENSYILQAGDALLVFPYQTHSFDCGKNGCCFTAVFSGEYVAAFTRLQQEPTDAFFRPAASTVAYLRENLMPAPGEVWQKSLRVEKPSLYALKASLYAIFSDFTAAVPLRTRTRSDRLIYEILIYIEDHYAEDISLQMLASGLSYNYHYISRLFNENLGISLKTLVNQYRYEQA